MEQARRLNPGIRFQVRDMLVLDRPDRTIAANIPKKSMLTSDLSGSSAGGFS